MLFVFLLWTFKLFYRQSLQLKFMGCVVMLIVILNFILLKIFSGSTFYSEIEPNIH